MAKKEAKWQQDEKDRLRSLYSAGVPVVEIAAALNRSDCAVYDHARRVLGLKHTGSPWRPWTKDDLLCLGQLYPSHSLGEIARVLRRSPSAIRQKVREKFPYLIQEHNTVFPLDLPSAKGARRSREGWQPDEDDTLRRMYASGVPVIEIAAALGRSINGVHHRAWVLGLKHSRGRKAIPWDEVQRDYDDGVSILTLCRRYHVGHGNLIRNIDTKPGQKKGPLSPEEEALIQEKYLCGCTLGCISASLGRSKTTIGRAIAEARLEDTALDTYGDILELAALLVREKYSAREIAEKLELPLPRAARLVGIAKEAL